jgi:hypothetical protein
MTVAEGPTSANPEQPGSFVDVGQVHVGDSQIRYVNFCRVTGTPEEMILDMGLQTPEGISEHVWHAPQRIALDFYTAKRLVYALHSTLTQFEATFGKIEVEVERRLVAPQ